MDNTAWAHLIVDSLIQQGIDHFFCAPGSRSTPLLLAVAYHKEAKAHIHFDERGLAFQAVGYAKGAKKPGVVIVTSGTAVGNLLPAIMEADLSDTPLIVLTADRPQELLDVGANQTCDQIKLFTNYTRFEAFLPTPESCVVNSLVSTMQQAVFLAQTGPVHINCPFREPLANAVFEKAPFRQVTELTTGKKVLSDAQIDALASFLFSKKRKGVILVGDGDVGGEEEICKLATQLQWPVFPDILAPIRNHDCPCVIAHYEAILKALPDLQVDCVIQFGNRFVSKTLLEWVNKQTLDYYVHISPHENRQDPYHLVTHRVQADPGSFAQALLKKEIFQEALFDWYGLQAATKEAMKSFFSHNPELTELSLFAEIEKRGWTFFVGSSMPIRDANLVFGNTAVFCNRGVSGIDGNIATAVGLAKALKRPVCAILGDLTALHDLNSLALLKELDTPFLLCIINNQGGGIFSFLPISSHKEPFEPFFAASHEWDFEHAARMFSLNYRTIDNLQQLPDTSYVLEIKTKREENVALRKAFIEHVRTCLQEALLAIPT